ncbi:hypothetical protein [Stenotrophomonas indicatrix]|uniref:hypothetical protein n=1 Tax=Stenotrophomonas indicatrix TaxID=2045451 RepID=UPI001AA1CF13|nr:hypothetical protein [Stenotrophomonas indicatrix]MBO1748891.1 hypothetical protein [Stenotrophomonas indicatrix]
MELVIVKPAELRAHWPVVSAALDSVIEATSPDWIKEDVYLQLANASAIAHLVYERGQYRSLFVLTQPTEEFSKERSLHIWIAENAISGTAESFDYGLSTIKQIAQQLGAPKLTLESPRKGWGKRFKLVSATYEVPLA